MDNGELSAEVGKQSVEDRTLQEISEKTWKEAEPVMNDWQKRLTNFEVSHRNQITQSIDNIAHLFGKEAPEKINVDLHYLAIKDSSKGEPASGLVNRMRLPEGDTNVFYWIGEITRLPNDGDEEMENDERMHTTKIIHEVIHQEFQGENEVFKKVLDEVNTDQNILRLRSDLMKNQAYYLEPEAEIMAIYLDHYADKLLKEESNENSFPNQEPTIVYRVDEKRFHEIFKAVVKEDESWEKDGPYTTARRGWGVEDKRKQAPESIQASIVPSEPSIYKLGEKITDFSLIEQYVQEGRRLDVNFVKELYKLFLAQRSF